MKHYNDVVLNSLGQAIAAASVTVNLAGTNTKAIIYSDDGVTTKTNPITTDALGRFDFYIADGRYDIAVSGARITSYTLTDVEIFDATQASTSDTAVTLESLSLVGNISGGAAGTAVGGALNIQKAASPSAIYMGRFIDVFGSTNAQLIGLSIEQLLNPSTTPMSINNFGQVTEMVVPTSNITVFSGPQIATYGSFSHFGSGNATGGMYGGSFEAFNAGPSNSLLLVGVNATANNGGVGAGVPFQTPTNNGFATHLRSYDSNTKNFSSGIVTNAVNFYAGGHQNLSSGSITNGYGLFVADLTTATNNFAIKTGVGQVSIGDKASFANTVTVTGGAGTGAMAIGTSGLLTSDVLFVGGSASTTGATQFGIQAAPTLGGTTTSVALSVRADVPSSTTIGTNFGIDVATPIINASGSITTWNGIRIEKPPVAGTAHSLAIAGSTSGLATLDAPATGGVASILPSTAGTLAVTVGSGTATMTTAAIASLAAGTTVTVAAPGVATTDIVTFSFNANPGTNPGALTVTAWPTSGNVNFAYVNPTAGSITPSAATLNWRVAR